MLHLRYGILLLNLCIYSCRYIKLFNVKEFLTFLQKIIHEILIMIKREKQWFSQHKLDLQNNRSLFRFFPHYHCNAGFIDPSLMMLCFTQEFIFYIISKDFNLKLDVTRVGRGYTLTLSPYELRYITIT